MGGGRLSVGLDDLRWAILACLERNSSRVNERSVGPRSRESLWWIELRVRSGKSEEVSEPKSSN